MKDFLAGNKSKQGVALLLTLWCVAVVAVSVVAVARLVDSDVDGESTRGRRFEARELALTGIAHGSNPALPRGSELLHQDFGQGGKLSVRVTSESARLNINLLLHEAGQPTLRALFQLWGVPEREARTAVDSLLDWIDPDDLRQLNGAERDDLQNQSSFSLPLNRDFHSISEMRRVRGMDAITRHQPEWSRFFSVFSGRQVDIQDAPPAVLRAVGGFSRDQATALAQYRNGSDRLAGTADDHLITTLDEVIQSAGLSEEQAEILPKVFAVGVEPTRIESTGEIQGTAFAISVVTNRQQKQPVYLSWEEQ